ncbi:MAG: DNA-methyltransferase [Isosphaeraceae bacterium]
MNKLYRGDCLKILRKLDAGSVDAVVTDPPYGLGFMGKHWDASVPGLQVWNECLRVLKPGAYLMAFGGTRTYHRLICSIEDAGFEIRDCLMWMYGSGFPKGKGCLKPAWEPITLARRPGGKVRPLGIEECRVGYHGKSLEEVYREAGSPGKHGNTRHVYRGGWQSRTWQFNAAGRWPPNVLLQHHPDCNGECHPECVVRVLGEQSGEIKSGGKKGTRYTAGAGAIKGYSGGWTLGGVSYGDSGTARRFFPQFRYAAKARRSERNAGGNFHPTVKPLAVMEWLVRLACPAGGLVLDPFAGSGTTGIACQRLGRSFIGIEISEDYFKIAKQRIKAEQKSADASAGSPAARKVALVG